MLIDRNIFDNQPLIVALAVGITAQIIKVLISYARYRTWNWALFLRAGGMPSSHAAMVAGVAHSIGLNIGFGSPIFAVAFVLAIVVIYDATGIRRQAGKHAEVINQMVRELASGHPLQQEQLREVLGHTPLEALAGMMLGVFFAQIFWLIWH
jgi:acid phosphatase family membrane protein YuiD